MEPSTSKLRPYADAPRLPEGDRIDARTLVSGPCARLEVEIGPGRGGFLLERLAAVPDLCMVGLEIRRKWAAIVDERLRKHGFGARGRVFAEDARLALERLVPDASVAAFFVHFPDPWWKKRHQKRLVMSPALLDAMARLLVPAGELFVQTDVEERALAYEAQVGAHAAFEAAGDERGSARMSENPYAARSPRERRAMLDGIPVTRLRFRRRPLPSPDRSAPATAGS